MTHIQKLITGLTLLTTPLSAAAYLTPEQVLLNDSVYLPPTARETDLRIEAQQAIGEQRRQETMERITPKPAAPAEDATDEMHEAAPAENEVIEAELLRTLRLLRRASENQAELRIGNTEVLHSGAPPLTPTGPGAVLSALTMLGAGFWTLRRAKKAEVGL